MASASLSRVALVLGVIIAVHLLVLAIRRIDRDVGTLPLLRGAKARTVTGLLVGTLIFLLYFGAFGWALSEFGVPLTGYIAGASVIGIAVGFGSQGVVQDVVMGLTLILTDLIRVDAVVTIGDQTGRVRRVGMRFLVLATPMGTEVFIPNRSVGNVVLHRHGAIRTVVDVTLPAAEALSDRLTRQATQIVRDAIEQFPGLTRVPPQTVGVFATRSGRRFFRQRLDLSAGRQPLLETLRAAWVQALKEIDPDFGDWQLVIAYEIEEDPPAPRRKSRAPWRI